MKPLQQPLPMRRPEAQLTLSQILKKNWENIRRSMINSTDNWTLADLIWMNVRLQRTLSSILHIISVKITFLFLRKTIDFPFFWWLEALYVRESLHFYFRQDNWSTEIEPRIKTEIYLGETGLLWDPPQPEQTHKQQAQDGKNHKTSIRLILKISSTYSNLLF